ncbi:MAG TPA: sulfate adenylyltransferase [Gaiellales bacterium]|jgi:sulfate adenylyltransferase
MSSPTAARKSGTLIAPHGGELVNRTVTGDDAAALAEQAKGLPRVHLSEKQTADLDMIASGALSPLTGFMVQADYDRVVEDMHLESGVPWALPVTLSVPERPSADRLALEGYEGELLAVIDVADVFEADRSEEAAKVFRTTDDAHPGVAQVYAEGRVLVGGPITVFKRPESAFPALHKDPADTRAAFAERGWSRVVGFQTRNPVHRAHEYIQKCALETVDGLLLHPLVGKTKGDDVPAEVRVRCYEVLLEKYYPADRTMLSAFPAAMRYAGPREAVWHAICRKNYGCSHFIVGRDHAGVGSYYGTYDAHLIFDQFEPHELDIEPMFFDHTFFCRTCGNMASAKTCPHPSEDHVHLSGTKVREMLGEGIVPPVEFSRPEVAQVLIAAYRD